MSSSRLPGKVLKPLLGRPMLARQMDRIAAARMVDLAVVATSDEATDDPIAALCAQENFACYRGPLADVLSRFAWAARAFGEFDHIVRLTGDCPLTDPSIIDACIALQLANGCDYTSNGVHRTYPNGLDVEVLTHAALMRTARDARAQDEHEHVTPFVYRNPHLFSQQALVYPENLASHRWTVDHPADFLFAERVFAELLPKDPLFSWRDVLELVGAKHEIESINSSTIKLF